MSFAVDKQNAVIASGAKQSRPGSCRMRETAEAAGFWIASSLALLAMTCAGSEGP